MKDKTWKIALTVVKRCIIAEVAVYDIVTMMRLLVSQRQWRRKWRMDNAQLRMENKEET